MNAKITLLLSLAVIAVSTATAQYYGDHHGHYHIPHNYFKARTDIATGVQSAVNENSNHSSNKNAGYNIAGKSNVQNVEYAQKDNYGESYYEQPDYEPTTSSYEPAQPAYEPKADYEPAKSTYVE